MQRVSGAKKLAAKELRSRSSLECAHAGSSSLSLSGVGREAPAAAKKEPLFRTQSGSAATLATSAAGIRAGLFERCAQALTANFHNAVPACSCSTTHHC
jgi:hypothetical protein